jgi:hypothetical protein
MNKDQETTKIPSKCKDNQIKYLEVGKYKNRYLKA